MAAVFVDVFLGSAFLAEGFAVAFAAGAFFVAGLAGVFLADTFAAALGAGFFVVVCLAGAFLAAVLGATFFVAAFLAGVLLAVVFGVAFFAEDFAAGFLAGAFLAGLLFAAGFLALVVFFAAVLVERADLVAAIRVPFSALPSVMTNFVIKQKGYKDSICQNQAIRIHHPQANLSPLPAYSPAAIADIGDQSRPTPP